MLKIKESRAQKRGKRREEGGKSGEYWMGTMDWRLGELVREAVEGKRGVRSV
jgi:hypothetical protein